MMEIRYRVWDPEEEGMSYPEDDRYTIDQDGSIDKWHEWAPKGTTAMLSTGLKDKDGREIFAGDLLRIHSLEKSCIGEVLLKDGNFRVVCAHCGESGRLDKAQADLLQVIGNIYQNPELVNG